MKKVCIVTIYDKNVNYGNKLQNLALKIELEKLRCEVDTLVTEKQHNITLIKMKSFINWLFRYRISDNQFIYRLLIRFYAFNKRLLSPVYGLHNKNKLAKAYDYFVVGSDQVWNANWFFEERPDAFLLTFVPSNKRISYAASFGVTDIPEKWKEFFSNNLGKFKNISVREESGKTLVYKLSQRKAEVLVDPTLLITAIEWRKIYKNKKFNLSNHYVLTYFLSPKNEMAISLINDLRNNFSIYEIFDRNDLVANQTGPIEFLYLIDNADLVITDSFHASVFSFIFNKPFVVYDRNLDGPNMNSRLETLLSKFHLERKYAGSGLPNDIWEHDYTEGYKQLEIEREKAINFLKKALED